MLLLRKECEPILDKAGFIDSEYVSSTSGRLSIMGLCGKAIVTIFTIEAPNRFTKETREYVLELFTIWIKKNSKDIILLISKIKDKRAELDAVKKADLIYIGDKTASVDLNSIHLGYGTALTVEILNDIVLKKDAIFEAIKIEASRAKIRDEIDDLNSKIREFSSCKV